MDQTSTNEGLDVKRRGSESHHEARIQMEILMYGNAQTAARGDATVVGSPESSNWYVAGAAIGYGCFLS